MSDPRRPLVSVIVPVHDGERFVAEAVRSALAQDVRPLEVVVVDDGSTDGTAAVVAGLGAPEVVLVRQANAGHGAAKNAGVARSRGDVLAFLDADDVWLPGKLAAQLSVLEASPEVGLTVCRMRNVVDPSAADRLSPAQAERLGGTPEAWLPSGLVVRRRAFEAIGPFDASLRIGNDTDWFARARAAGVRSAVVDQVLLERRIHAGNDTAAVADVHDDLLEVVRRTIARRRGARG